MILLRVCLATFATCDGKFGPDHHGPDAESMKSKLRPSFDGGRQAERFPICQEQARRGGGNASRRRGQRPTQAPAGGESSQPRRSRSNSRDFRARWDWSNASPESISSPASIASESRSRRPIGGRRLASPSEVSVPGCAAAARRVHGSSSFTCRTIMPPGRPRLLGSVN